MKKRKITLRGLKNKAWKLVSRYVRLKDADVGGYVSCYTCGAPIHAILEAQAGHAIPGRHGAVLFDVEIIRPQCYRCNCAMGGRYEIFAAKLIRENGLEWFEEKLSNARQAVKWDRSAIEGLIESYQTKLKELETV